MHVNGHKCHIAYLVPWNMKQLLTFNKTAKQGSISILGQALQLHGAADFPFRNKEETKLMFFLSRSSHILPAAGRAGEWETSKELELPFLPFCLQ